MKTQEDKFKILGIIPARGGSKSIHKKNIIDLGGHPLIHYTIQAGVSSFFIDDLIVSTDCEEIANVSKELGVSVPFLRPKEIATDTTDSLSVVKHALDFMEEMHECHYDAIILLQPTTPFRAPGLIDDAISILKKGSFDSVVTVVDVGASHPQRMYTLDSNNILHSYVKNDIDPMMPRQQLPKVLIRSGDIYATSRNCITKKSSLIGDYSYGLEIDSKYSVNIDEAIDLEIARLKLIDFLTTFNHI